MNPWFWVPLAVAAPFVGVELWFDMRSRGRRLIPELAGTFGIGSVVAAIVLIGRRVGVDRCRLVGGGVGAGCCRDPVRDGLRYSALTVVR